MHIPILLVLLLALCQLPDTASASPSLLERFPLEAHHIVHGEFAVSDAESPPLTADWTPIELPHLWGRSGLEATRGWYRFPLADAQPDGRQGIYLWRFSMNAAVWLNDEFLGDGGRFTEPVARNWNRPFLFLLPTAAWRPADNYLYVRLATYPGWGNLPPLVIGPWDELRKDYEKRFYWQVTLSQATFVVSLITAIVALSLWAADRGSRLYLFFGASALAWTMYSLNLFMQEIPVSAKIWWWAVHSSVEWYGVMLALFAHRLIGLRLPRVEAVLLAFATIATLTYGVVELRTLSAVNNLFHAVSLLVVLYLFGLGAWFAWRRRAWHLGAFAACAAIIFAFGLHDFSMNAMLLVTLWIEQFFVLQFSAPIMMITMLAILSYRFVTGLREQAEAEARLRLERERIFTDIHDDVGSKVLSLVYSADTDEQAGLAREALRDIRAIVAGGMRVGGALPEVLEPCQAEARQRCEQAGVELGWTGEVSPDVRVDDAFQYHLQRIFRELVSNAIKHAHTRRLEVVVAATASDLALVVRDFGCGLADAQPGTGMAGIRRRAVELGGSVAWRDTAPGCSVEVVLPL